MFPPTSVGTVTVVELGRNGRAVAVPAGDDRDDDDNKQRYDDDDGIASAVHGR
jgi:hypothetical protein